MVSGKPRSLRTFRRKLASYFYVFALSMAALAALFGFPLIIDPPPGDRVCEAQDVVRKRRRMKRWRRRRHCKWRRRSRRT